MELEMVNTPQEEAIPQPAADAAPVENLSDPLSPDSQMEKDIRNFLQTFPDVKPAEIPRDVWSDVQRGRSLVEAYQGWQGRQLQAENQRLRQALEASEQNIRNRAQSAGTQRTAGAAQEHDRFLSALLDD